MSAFLCFGEVLFDGLPTGPVVGGAPLNVALHLHQWGQSTHIASALGPDAHAETLRAFLSERGFPLTGLAQHPSWRTGWVDVTLDAKGSPSYDICAPAAWDGIPFDAVLAGQAEVLVFGSLALRNSESLLALQDYLKAVPRRVMDINLRAPYVDWKVIEPLMRQVEVIKLNRDELHEWLNFRELSAPQEGCEDLALFAEHFPQAEHILVTDGAKGAYLLAGGNVWHHPIFPVDVVDTVGSGDAFLAGYLYAQAQGQSIADTLRWASAAACRVSGSQGATPILPLDLLHDFLATHPPMNYRASLWAGATGLLMQACAPTQPVADVASDALYRPALHFTPQAHWMNDPNGLFFDGVDTYHLYYQFYPDSTVWGPMHWGHATTKDLIHWEHQPVALAPDDLGYIFSGSAVVDVNNTSGLGSAETPAVVAIYTYHRPSDNHQTQGIAYSLDGGYTFTKYANNPVMANPGEQDFRDPKVSWHKASGQWVMALAVGQHIRFYSSPNLIDWTYASSFGEGVGAHGGVWECPDLIPFTASDGTQKWVLFVSINPGHPAGGSGTQYFVGNFDGVTFTPDDADPPVLWLDAGRDNYAGVTFHQKGLAGSGPSPLFIGWMSNWEYGQQVPTEAWRSAMTLARDLELKATPAGYRLNQWVTSDLFTAEAWTEAATDADSYPIADAHQLVIEWEGPGLVNLLWSSDAGDTLTLRMDEQGVTVDRRGLQNLDFSPKFASIEHVDFVQQGDGQHLVILDGSSLEYLGESGLVSLTDLFFVKQWFSHLHVTAQEGVDVTVHRRASK